MAPDAGLNKTKNEEAKVMALKVPPLATTHVGSMPRPRWMGETDRNRVTFRLEDGSISGPPKAFPYVEVLKRKSTSP
jgi:hypothetical protein